MTRSSGYIVIFLFFISSCGQLVRAQDTIEVPLKIKVGLEVSGPAIYYFDKKILNAEGFISVDADEKHSYIFSAGYNNYNYSQYNYSYKNNGIYARAGIDFNLLKPEKAQGKYWAGIGLHYGISRFTSQIPFFEKGNYWDTISTGIPRRTNWAHFVEATPGVRAEVLKNFSIGWSINIRMLLYSGTGKSLKALDIPGFGNATKKFSTGINYFIVWNIPYKKITVITKKEVPEETEEPDNNTNSINGQQGGTIRQ